MRPSLRRRLTIGGSTLVVVGIAGAVFATTAMKSSGPAGYDGTAIAPALARPAAALTTALVDTSDKPFALGTGKTTLVYFGYTHCPDLCPTTMADVHQALEHVSPAVRAETQVVFVTVDPQ